VDLAISSEWLEFLEKLSHKKVGEPLSYYCADSDILHVICGSGPCSDWNKLCVGPMIFAGVDVIDKMYPEDFGPGDDTFAGLEIWGGVQDFLSHHYQRIAGEKYETFRLAHNLGGMETPVVEIIHLLLKDERGLVKPAWALWEDRVAQALKEQAPSVHIPLVPV
jgi:hypothetical protein